MEDHYHNKSKMNIWAKLGIGCLSCIGLIVLMGIILGGCSLLWFSVDTNAIATDGIEVSIFIEEDLKEIKATAKTIEYPHLKKNPEKYKDEYVKYTGKIVQILESKNRTDIRLAITETDYGYDYSEIIYITYAGTTDYVEGDIVTIYGTITGTYRYKSQANWTIELPGVHADYISD